MTILDIALLLLIVALAIVAGILTSKLIKLANFKTDAQAKASALEEINRNLMVDLNNARSKSEDLNSALQTETQARIAAELELKNSIRRMETEKDYFEKQRLEDRESQKQFFDQSEAKFRIMAQEIMQQQSENLNAQNELKIGQMLNPLKENIEQFRRDVNQCYSNEARERFSLHEKIKELVEANNNIGKEARELASALRGNSKKQGDWGELVLESILENSGLRAGQEFTIQQTQDERGQTLRDADGRGLRPDVVVHYPGGKDMIIDSKVSLTAFVDYVNAEDAEEQERLGKLHLASVVKHINELSDKKYQDYIGIQRLDFVMMFIPNESAYATALTLDPTLWQKAYDKRVLLVSPTQLVGSLRLIKQLWDHDRQTRNAIEIAEKSGQMYDKFVGFVADLEKIGKSLQSTQTAYDSAMNKLSVGRGNLIGRAETLRELGIKTSKRLSMDSANQSSDE